MAANSSRLMATWRCLTGTRSPATASAIGNTPPAAMPATTRKPISISKLSASPDSMVVAPRISMQPMISRVLLSMSASAPSTGWISA